MENDEIINREMEQRAETVNKIRYEISTLRDAKKMLEAK